MAIDNPLKAVEKQIRADEMNPVTAGLVRGIKAAAGQVPVFGVLFQVVTAVLDKEASDARVVSLLRWMDDEVQRLGRRLDDLTHHLRADPFIDTLVSAADRAQRTTNPKKVQRFAVVLGRELASENPDWDEVQSFVRDISELGEMDIKALKVLHESERLYNVQPAESRNTRAAHDEGFYSKKGLINDEDFYSRCGRLYGFGLALLNNETTFATPQHNLFRISPRGNRLARLLQGTQ